MPGASYMVSSISSASRRISASMAPTGVDTCGRTGSGRMMSGLSSCRSHSRSFLDAQENCPWRNPWRSKGERPAAKMYVLVLIWFSHANLLVCGHGAHPFSFGSAAVPHRRPARHGRPPRHSRRPSRGAVLGHYGAARPFGSRDRPRRANVGAHRGADGDAGTDRGHDRGARRPAGGTEPVAQPAPSTE